MHVLIDYDNVDPSDRRHGIEKLVMAVVDSIAPREFKDGDRIGVRIYGGWFRGADRSPRAKEVLSDLAAAAAIFAAPITIVDGKVTKRVLVQAELADALLAAPSSVLVDTYREGRADLSNLIFAKAPYSRCVAPNACSLRAVVQIIDQEGCPVPGCQIRMPHVTTRREQKLVDAMLVADMIEIARRGPDRIVVVSSDDDIWPGVLAASSLGARVFHFQSRSRSTPAAYTATASPKLYSQHVLPQITR